ncbi:hypothetical protein B0H14DRAFT_3116907 [Mycena olivaceomarginata]|nr:hypothetical protein B0H14DRAFT_3116907 [Mycena olivaceomarginata]
MQLISRILAGQLFDPYLLRFVDAHVHFLLHSYSETSWADQVTKESLESALYARKTLLAGYTSVRDLGTEGAEDDDIALRKCLVSGPQPLVPGPRYFTANRAIVSTGSYGLTGPKGSIHFNKEGVESIVGAEAADGPDECIRAVRKQIGAGADWIKPSSTPAHQYGVKIAAHTKTVSVIKVLLELGIDSLEHGLDLHTSADAVRTLASSGCRTVYIALACGGDARVFPHGENALEMELMVRLGAPWEWVLRWVTLGGWECIIGEQDAADLVGLNGDLATEFAKTVRSVEFVMKAGRVYNQGGNQVI